MVRFDLRFAPGGIVALTHDTIIVTGVFALLWKEFNLQTIAALLTIIGYSLNDTIVVFDRIREVKGKNPKLTEEMLDNRGEAFRNMMSWRSSTVATTA